MDITARNNERNLEMSRDPNDDLSADDPPPLTTAGDGSRGRCTPIQAFYNGANIFITGGTGEWRFILFF